MSEKLAPLVEKRRQFMLDCAEQLGQRAWSMIRSDVPVTSRLKTDGSIVTDVDEDLNGLFNELIETTYPYDYVHGEESSYQPGGRSFDDKTDGLWTIDPIDGTKGFWRDYQNRHFTSSNTTIQIAWFAPGETSPTLSTIYAPFNESRPQLMADPSGAHFRTGQSAEFMDVHVERGPLTLSDIRRFDKNFWSGADEKLKHMELFFPYARRVNHPMGYAAIALGDCDLGVFPGTHPHDVAPNAHLIHQAGGHVRTLRGETYDQVDWRKEPVLGVVAAASHGLVDEFLSSVMSIDQRGK